MHKGLKVFNFQRDNVCLSIDTIYGMETPIPLLKEDIKKCTKENTSEAKNKILSEKLQQSEKTTIILTEDIKELNSAYNWKLVEITKTKRINENLEKSLNRYVKVSEVCENKNQKLENDLKRVFHLLSKGNT